MKDLKHMIYFEKLLDSACNDLVREAQKENRVAVGYTCFHIPEVLLNLDHCFSVRLRAPYMGSPAVPYFHNTGSCIHRYQPRQSHPETEIRPRLPVPAMLWKIRRHCLPDNTLQSL